jgi:hypothetical protein
MEQKINCLFHSTKGDNLGDRVWRGGQQQGPPSAQ